MGPGCSCTHFLFSRLEYEAPASSVGLQSSHLMDFFTIVSHLSSQRCPFVTVGLLNSYISATGHSASLQRFLISVTGHPDSLQSSRTVLSPLLPMRQVQRTVWCLSLASWPACLCGPQNCFGCISVLLNLCFILIWSEHLFMETEEKSAHDLQTSVWFLHVGCSKNVLMQKSKSKLKQ